MNSNSHPSSWEILRQVPLNRFLPEVVWKIKRETNYRYFDLSARLFHFQPETVSGKSTGNGILRKFLHHRVESSFFLFPELKNQYRHIYSPKGYEKTYSHFMPEYKKEVIDTANAICQNQIPIFGKSVDFNASGIDWHRDFQTGFRWSPQGFYYRKEELASKAVKKNWADVKIPWELSRLQFLIPLGVAYWITEEEKYAEHFTRFVSHWIEHNPPYRGVNWACAMEVAMRAISLIWGLGFFLEAPEVSDELVLNIKKVLICSHLFIKGNLERKLSASGNHYLANLVGLIHLAVFLPDECGKNLSWAVKELCSEIINQTYPDGVSFEASTGYHRLALELFASAARLCAINKIPLTAAFRERLTKMFEYSESCLRSGYSAPGFGDNDSSRLFSFCLRPDNDHSYLPGIAHLLKKAPTKTTCSHTTPEILWLFGPEAVNDAMRSHKKIKKEIPPSAEFTRGGRFFLRDDDNFQVAVSCGPNGLYNLGSHAHNDKLSFELNLEGFDFIVDPGTYIYTADLEQRLLFRSTAYHNTVRVDRQEQNRLYTGRPFFMENDAQTQGKIVRENENIRFQGFHGGYRRLRDPLIHHREMILNRQEQTLEILDWFEGTGKHLLEWYFHLHPNVRLSVAKGSVFLKRGKKQLEGRLAPMEERELSAGFEVGESWYSPGYNRKAPSKHLYFSREVYLPYSLKIIFQKILHPVYSS